MRNFAEEASWEARSFADYLVRKKRFWAHFDEVSPPCPYPHTNADLARLEAFLEEASAALTTAEFPAEPLPFVKTVLRLWWCHKYPSWIKKNL